MWNATTQCTLELLLQFTCTLMEAPAEISASMMSVRSSAKRIKFEFLGSPTFSLVWVLFEMRGKYLLCTRTRYCSQHSAHAIFSYKIQVLLPRKEDASDLKIKRRGLMRLPMCPHSCSRLLLWRKVRLSWQKLVTNTYRRVVDEQLGDPVLLLQDTSTCT